MKKSAKVGIAALAVIATGTLGLALPALADDRGEREGHSGMSHEARSHEDHNRATLDAAVTAIPEDVTEARAAHAGAYFTVYLLDSDATSVPDQEPTEDGRRIGIRPISLDGDTPTRTEIEDGTLSGLLGFRAPTEAGVTKLALYPSDGTSPVLVTITVDDEGNATATSSGPLSVAYSADVAAEHQEKRGHPGFRGGKHRGHMGPSFEGERQMPNA
ncbi:MAG: hypothetical protein VW942_06280 [Aquiluna sp.]